MDKDTPNSKTSSTNINSSIPTSTFSANRPQTPIITLHSHLHGEMVPPLPLTFPKLHERQQLLFRAMIGIAKVDFSMKLRRIWRRKVGLILRRVTKMIGCLRLMTECLELEWWLWSWSGTCCSWLCRFWEQPWRWTTRRMPTILICVSPSWQFITSDGTVPTKLYPFFMAASALTFSIHKSWNKLW